MSPAETIFEQIAAEAARLSVEDRLRLIQHLAGTLIPAPARRHPRRLVYGEFAGQSMSTEEDFEIAEWRPSERELNGVLACSRYSRLDLVP